MVEEVKLSLYQLGNYVIESSLPMGNYYSVKLGILTFFLYFLHCSSRPTQIKQKYFHNKNSL